PSLPLSSFRSSLPVLKESPKMLFVQNPDRALHMFFAQPSCTKICLYQMLIISMAVPVIITVIENYKTLYLLRTFFQPVLDLVFPSSAAEILRLVNDLHLIFFQSFYQKLAPVLDFIP